MRRSLVIKSLDAERDLAGLFDFITQDSGIERAEHILRRIDQRSPAWRLRLS